MKPFLIGAIVIIIVGGTVFTFSKFGHEDAMMQQGESAMMQDESAMMEKKPDGMMEASTSLKTDGTMMETGAGAMMQE